MGRPRSHEPALAPEKPVQIASKLREAARRDEKLGLTEGEAHVDDTLAGKNGPTHGIEHTDAAQIAQIGEP